MRPYNTRCFPLFCVFIVSTVLIPVRVSYAMERFTASETSAEEKLKQIRNLTQTNPKEAMRLVENLSDDERSVLEEESIRTMKPKIVTGKVIDTEENPIADAKVTLEMYQYSGDQSLFWEKHFLVTNTNPEGCYQFVCEKTRSASVTACKPGYAAVYRSGAETVIGGAPYIKDRGILVLRKQGPLSFLLKIPERGNVETGWFSVRGTNCLLGTFDILSKIGVKPPNTMPKYCDLKININHNAESNEWQVVFFAANRNGSVLMTDKRLYEAPETGYGQAVRFSVSDTGRREIYLYLRTRSPAIYSRIELKCNGLNEYKIGKTLGFSYLLTVNPYGERTFEYDERYDKFWREKPKWIEDAKAALREGKYPEKIDIDALVRDGGEAAESRH